MKPFWVMPLSLGLIVVAACSMAVAQPTFSVDFQGPTGTLVIPDSFFGASIGAADILSGPVGFPPIGSPGPGPLPPPGMVVHGGLPFPPPAGVRTLGLIPGQVRTAEVDALSYGRDWGEFAVFSVDEHATGHPGIPAFPPNVLSEGLTGPGEASADVFSDVAGLIGIVLAGGVLPPAPPLPGSPPAGNTAVLDGDGLFPSGLPGFGLVEPNPPSPGAIPDPGDNLDALNLDTTLADIQGPIYFSLDSNWNDPIEGPPANSGSAIANGFVSGDVIVNIPGAGNILYAPANVLGLDLTPGAGPDSDDLDALALFDGDGVPLQYNPMTDVLLFSVRRGSAITNAVSGGAVVDSIFGVPIEEGDVLIAPGTWGIVPGPTPGILIPGEWLGLSTMRSGGPLPFGPFSDELDALDVVPEPSSLVLLGIGVVVLLAWRRRKRAV